MNKLTQAFLNGAKNKPEPTKDVVVRKFIVEFTCYPNGDMYPKGFYPVGGASKFVKKGKKSDRKKESKKSTTVEDEVV